MTDFLAHDARLIVLKELSVQPSYALNETLLQAVLEQSGITRSRDWLREQLRWLAEVGAISVREVGNAKIAVLTEKGLDHVDYRIVLGGVKRPSPRD
jgi:hypothetical protein